MMGRVPRDFSSSPFIVFYEVTRSCDLVCRHCRACAQAQADANELSHAESLALIARLAQFEEPPLLVVTGAIP
ncbi:MAG: hypothetical protein U0794_11585 [Isosphaeraceae bacterium]